MLKCWYPYQAHNSSISSIYKLCTGFLIHFNFLYRLLCKELWSKGFWLWSGCRRSCSFPVKPEALAHLGLTSGGLWYHNFWDLSVNMKLISLCPFTLATGNEKWKKHTSAALWKYSPSKVCSLLDVALDSSVYNPKSKKVGMCMCYR